jgi:hypothetical protein
MRKTAGYRGQLSCGEFCLHSYFISLTLIQVFDLKMARATGLEPATSSVTDKRLDFSVTALTRFFLWLPVF